MGKTTIAAGAAAVAARWELRACLIDLDLSCGNAYASFGLPGGGDLAALGEVAPEPDILARLVVPAMPDVALLGPCGRPELAELVTPHVGTVLAWAERAYDLVVVDASTTFTDAVAEAVQRADRVVLVADGRPGALSSVARMGGLVVRLGGCANEGGPGREPRGLAGRPGRAGRWGRGRPGGRADVRGGRRWRRG